MEFDVLEMFVVDKGLFVFFKVFLIDRRVGYKIRMKGRGEKKKNIFMKKYLGKVFFYFF